MDLKNIDISAKNVFIPVLEAEISVLPV